MIKEGDKGKTLSKATQEIMAGNEVSIDIHRKLTVYFLSFAMVGMKEGLLQSEATVWCQYFESRYFNEGTLSEFTEAFHRELKKQKKWEMKHHRNGAPINKE